MNKLLPAYMIISAAFISFPSAAYGNPIRDIAILCNWQFGRTNGDVIAKNMRLTPDGLIEGYSNPNEREWKIDENGNIIFMNRSLQPTTRFESARIVDGRVVLIGQQTGNFAHTLTCN